MSLEQHQTVGHDLCMVESECRKVVDREPSGAGGVVLSSGGYWGVNDGKVSHGDGAATRVTVNLGVGTDLKHFVQFQACFFLEFTEGALFGRFVYIEESAGNGPAPLERFIASFDQ